LVQNNGPWILHYAYGNVVEGLIHMTVASANTVFFVQLVLLIVEGAIASGNTFIRVNRGLLGVY
jgi:hypothetical protein